MSCRFGLLLCFVWAAVSWTTGCGGPASTGPKGSSGSASTGTPGIPTPAASTDGDAGQWPRFHGPTGYNISGDSGLLKEWPDGGPTLLWTAEGIGEGFSSVTLAAGRIYTAGNVGGQTTVTALDLDGNHVWQSPNGKPWTGSYEGTRGTPTIDGDRIYHQSPVGRLVCLAADDGREIWSKDVLAEFGARNIKWAMAESVLVDGDRVVSCPGGSEASVVALDKMTGETVWTTPSTGEATGYASPVVAECGGIRMILAMNAKAAIGVDAQNGELLWKWKHETKYDVNAMMPLYHDGRVFISSGYGAGSEMLELAVDGGRVSASRAWESKDLDNHHGGVILFDGYIYGAASQPNRGPWVCLDWRTGEKMYAEKGVGKGSLTCADGLLYTLSENRVMGLVEPSPAGHNLITRFEIPAGGQGKSWAHPVVHGGRLYIRHGDFLYAYDVAAPAGR